MTQIAISHVGSVAFSTESGRGVAIVVCVLLLVEGNLLVYLCCTHTTVATPLPFFARKVIQYVRQLFLSLYG